MSHNESHPNTEPRSAATAPSGPTSSSQAPPSDETTQEAMASSKAPPVDLPHSGSEGSPEPQPHKGRRRTFEDLSEEEREEILHLHGHGYGTRQIARRVGWSRKIVRRTLREQGRLRRQGSRAGYSKLVPFREQIDQRVRKDLTTTRILREIRELGYDGGRTILGDYVRDLRAQLGLQPHKRVKRRFETAPGVEMQVDWSPYDLTIAGRLTKVHALGCLLCASRKLYLRFYRDERQSTLLEGLASAFEYFHGGTLRMVLDNMATAILGRIGPNRKELWHPRFAEFATHYGSKPFACAVRDPDRKGKKEKSFRLVWDDFLKGTEFESWEDLDYRRTIWLDETPEVANLRVHGTTRRVPNEAWLDEREFLIRLPEERFPVYEDSVRVVDEDSTLSIRGTRYTVPSSLANRSVAVHLFAEHFEVLDRHGQIAFSRRYVPDSEKGTLKIDKTHYATLPRRPRGGGERLDEAFVKRFPELEPLVSGLKLKMKSLAPMHVRWLIRLVDRYGEEAFLAAAHRAQDYGRYDALAVERILEREHPLVEQDTIAPLTGIGPRILGEVEQGSLDSYAHLDGEAADPPADDADDADGADDTDNTEEVDHGA